MRPPFTVMAVLLLAAIECAAAFVALSPRAVPLLSPSSTCARALPSGRRTGLTTMLTMQEKWKNEGLRNVKERPAVAVGDAVALLTFAAIGRGNHASSDGSVLLTAFPFLLSWFLCAPVLGAYRSSPSLKQAVTTALPAWALSVPLGCLLRGLLQDRVCVCSRASV
jgi:hypothetical protein